MTEARIERIAERIVYADPDNRWVRLYFDDVRFPDGREGRYNRVVESEGRPGVAVLPVRGEDIGVVSVFRYPINSVVWEIPRGFGESQDARAEAVRELAEETGNVVVADTLVDLGFVYPDSGLLAGQVQLFAADCRGADASEQKRDGEVMDFRWLPVGDVLAAISTGEISDGFTICAVLRAQLRGVI